jgi:hypothetical protein
MRGSIRLVGCSISFLAAIACSRSGIDVSEVADATSSGPTGSGGSAGNFVPCPRGYAGPECDTPTNPDPGWRCDQHQRP